MYLALFLIVGCFAMLALLMWDAKKAAADDNGPDVSPDVIERFHAEQRKREIALLEEQARIRQVMAIPSKKPAVRTRRTRTLG